MLSEIDWSLLCNSSKETLYMVFITTIFTAFIGIFLGVLLVITDKGHLWEKLWFHRILGFFVNIFRAAPFIVLILFLFPLTKLIIGTILGPVAATVPLIAAASPFYARIVEMAIREIDYGVIEASQAMGASKWMIVRKVLIPEALPAIISGLTTTCISIISYSAMAGIVGAGGLGDTAYRYGFQSFNDQMLYACGILLILLVQMVQCIGDWILKCLDKR